MSTLDSIWAKSGVVKCTLQNPVFADKSEGFVRYIYIIETIK